MNKSRVRAYRILKVGLRYHKDEQLSFLTVGLRKGSEADLRTTLRRFRQYVKRQGYPIDYFCTFVTETERTHLHLIWNAPYIKWDFLLSWFTSSLGEQCSVYIQLVRDESKTAKYVMQYSINQQGNVRYSCSRNWLPKGYGEAWKAMKHDFWHHVSRKDLQSDYGTFTLASQHSPTWRKALIDEMNKWIDEKRDYQVTL